MTTQPALPTLNLPAGPYPALPCVGAPVWVSEVASRVRAGFPSPAEDFLIQRVDLMAKLVKHPQATYLIRVRGESMREAGIFDGDVVMVDRAIKPRHGQIVVAVVDGDFTIKQLHQRQGQVKLKAANPTFPDITPKDGQTLEIWGVVTSSIKQFPN